MNIEKYFKDIIKKMKYEDYSPSEAITNKKEFIFNLEHLLYEEMSNNEDALQAKLSHYEQVLYDFKELINGETPFD